VVFKSGEVQHRIEIGMPDCVGEADENVDAEEQDVVSFSL